MAFKVQVLTKADYQPAARHASIRHAWVNVGRSTRSRAKAERTLLNLRIDQPDSTFRIREIAA
ncbi:hypothetical protein ACVIGB_006619 [Bradyrhizobium sp. USDA 4341]